MKQTLRKRFTTGAILLAACTYAVTSGVAFAQASGTNANATQDSGSGKSAGYAGGGGAVGSTGTDPATLKRIEENRIKKKNAAAGSGPNDAKRKDWKE
jgi:hypothetical protein